MGRGGASWAGAWWLLVFVLRWFPSMGEIQLMCDMYMDEVGIHMLIIMWSMLYNTRADHMQPVIHSGCLNERLNTILIWRTATLDPWHSHGMIYLHNWSRMVHNYRDSLTESESLYGTICRMNHESIQKHCYGGFWALFSMQTRNHKGCEPAWVP